MPVWASPGVAIVFVASRFSVGQVCSRMMRLDASSALGRLKIDLARHLVKGVRQLEPPGGEGLGVLAKPQQCIHC